MRQCNHVTKLTGPWTYPIGAAGRGWLHTNIPVSVALRDGHTQEAVIEEHMLTQEADDTPTLTSVSDSLSGLSPVSEV